LKFYPNGYTKLTSAPFSSADLDYVGDTLSLDVFLSKPVGKWWVGDVNLTASCPSANLYGQWIGYASLSNLFVNEFNQLTFSVPEAVRTAWAGDHTDCTVEIAMSVAS